jgi:D-alanyl-D-alanine carboxypeptidase/D-alanyl-D-alanine-endopeptidase (penicillin-binding protein 4)
MTKHRPARALVCLFTVLAACGHVLAQAGSLGDEVARLVNGRKLSNARVGVSIVDLETETALASLNAQEPFTPASNMKLLTSGAALLVLRPGFSFATEIIRDGDRLIIRGAGDPALADPAVLSKMEPKLSAGDVLAVLAGAVSKAGMTEVREIIVDDRVFDREYVHPTWPADQLDRGYCAEVCGLNFHANVLAFFPRPNPEGAGTPPLFSMQPEAPWLRIDVRARTVADGKNSVWITREDASNQFTLRGDVRFPAQVPVEVTYHNPAEFFGRLLAQQLVTAGIRVAPMPGGVQGDRAVRLAGEQEQLPAGAAIAVIRTPITEVLHRCNSDSENLYAESLLKRMGHAVTREPGSWANGASVLRMMITERIGAHAAAATTITDGSGMSRQNLVAPATLTAWLGNIAADTALADTFIESLAVPGQGTLRARFQNTRLQNQLHAKSGYITGVRTLSGYLTHENGRRVAFSIMCNDVTTDEERREALELHEDVIKLADRWLSQRAGAEAKVGG